MAELLCPVPVLLTGHHDGRHSSLRCGSAPYRADVEIIIDDQDVFRFDLVEAGQGGNRPATVVHPCLGLCQDDTTSFDQTVGGFRIVLGAGKAEAVGTGHGFDGAEPDVVTIVRVAWPGIPKAGNEGELAQALGFRFDCLR